MPTDHTAEWGDKLAELASLPAENVVHSRLTGIAGTGIATLVSKLKQDPKPSHGSKPSQGPKAYGGFALTLTHDTEHKNFEWLQFITRQLVIGGAAKAGNLVMKTNTTSYQLVESEVEITDYAFATGSKPSNWNTCWKVDSSISKPFFRDVFEYAISDAHKLTAIMDNPSILIGKKLKPAEIHYYEDAPGNTVDMKDALGTGDGISRAYFSDYLVKKEANGKWRIYARFDFSLTWKAKDADKNNFTLRSLSATTTTSLLDCHMDALNHKTIKHVNVKGKPSTESTEPWKSFRDLIL